MGKTAEQEGPPAPKGKRRSATATGAPEPTVLANQYEVHLQPPTARAKAIGRTNALAKSPQSCAKPALYAVSVPKFTQQASPYSPPNETRSNLDTPDHARPWRTRRTQTETTSASGAWSMSLHLWTPLPPGSTTAQVNHPIQKAPTMYISGSRHPCVMSLLHATPLRLYNIYFPSCMFTPVTPVDTDPGKAYLSVLGIDASHHLSSQKTKKTCLIICSIDGRLVYCRWPDRLLDLRGGRPRERRGNVTGVPMAQGCGAAPNLVRLHLLRTTATFCPVLTRDVDRSTSSTSNICPRRYNAQDQQSSFVRSIYTRSSSVCLILSSELRPSRFAQRCKLTSRCYCHDSSRPSNPPTTAGTPLAWLL